MHLQTGRWAGSGSLTIGKRCAAAQLEVILDQRWQHVVRVAACLIVGRAQSVLLLVYAVLMLLTRRFGHVVAQVALRIWEEVRV